MPRMKKKRMKEKDERVLKLDRMMDEMNRSMWKT